MIATSIFFTIVGIMLAIVIGVNIGSDIDEPELYFMFWLMYIITVSTIVNIGFSIYYYMKTRHIRGPRGSRGQRGDLGTSGPSGKCDPGCRNKVCTDTILEQMAQQIRQLSADPAFQSSDIRNAYLRKTIRRICHSPQFQQLAPLKGPTALIDYIKGIWSEITTLLYEEGGQRYFKTVGAEQAFDWRNGNNPWDEFKKYGVYYWGLDKDQRPEIIYTNDKTVVDGSIPVDAFNTLMGAGANNNSNNNGNNNNGVNSGRDDKPRASILGFINAESSGEIYNVTKNRRGTYIIEANMVKPSKTIMQKYTANTTTSANKHIPALTYMVRDPSQPEKCLDTSGKYTAWKLCDPFNSSQRFTMDWTNVADRQFRLKSVDGRYLVGSGSKFMLTDNKTVGNEYRFQSRDEKN